MKLFKTVLALLLSTVFAISVFTLSAAAAPGGTITLRETSSSVSIDGKVFNAYRLFDVTTDGSGNYAYTFANPAVAGYFAAKIPAVTTAAGAVAYINAMGAEAFAKEIYKAISGGTLLLTPATAVASGDTAVFSGLAMGYYLIVDATTGVSVTRSACILTTNDDDLDINIKSDLPWVEKTITNGTDGSDKATFADAGDVIDFKLESAVPDMTGYDKYFFIVKDTMTYLTLPAGWQDDLVVKIGSTVLTADQYTATASGGNAIKIVFKNFIQYKEQAGEAIEITFSAIYTPGGQNKTGVNEVYVTYSNDPLYDYQGIDEPNPDDPTDDTPPDEVKVYSFSIKLIKVDGEDDEVVLEGATFELYKYEGGSWVLKKTVTTDADGLALFGQLGTGKYRLVETDAPIGYNLIEDPIDLSITASFDGTDIMQIVVDNPLFSVGTIVGLCPNPDENIAIVGTIANNAGGILPGTGGIGNTVFIVSGLALMAGAALLLMFRKKKALVK